MASTRTNALALLEGVLHRDQQTMIDVLRQNQADLISQRLIVLQFGLSMVRDHDTIQASFYDAASKHCPPSLAWLVMSFKDLRCLTNRQGSSRLAPVAPSHIHRHFHVWLWLLAPRHHHW